MDAASRTSSGPPRRLGPYWIEATLGRGGMGVVYRARHLDSGQRVALKTLAHVDPALLGTLWREILMLHRVDHPGVVRILASGRDEGVPWYAMELIEGEPFESRLGERPERADGWALESVEPGLRVLLQLSETLAALHGEGIVHRDLKPSNVILREGREPVLVDFGLVSRFAAPMGRESLEVGGEVLGTFDYMAPEQAAGDYVDARADLYSLGCMLYELVTGAPPFSGDAWTVVRKHRSVEVPPPSGCVPALPQQLEELILRLLEKEPRRRLPYASDVAARLADLLSEPAFPSAAPRVYLYRASFSGRSRELAGFADRLEAARAGRGGCVLIQGESGVGKTRLAMESTRVATRRGFQVVTGECIPVEGAGPGRFLAAPLHPLRPLLRAIADHCIAGGPETTRRLLGERASVLAPYEETLRHVPGFAGLATPAELPTQAAQSRLVGDLIETVRTFAAERPLALVIDDLQWADEMTVTFLEALSPERLEGAPLLVLGTYRSDEARTAVAELGGASHVRRIELGRIDERAVETIVSDMLALSTPPPLLVRFLTETSEGNPFFVSEYLRAAVESGMLRRSEAGRWEVATPTHREDEHFASLPLPRALADLLERRIDELGSATTRWLEAASVLGREFEVELATFLCGGDEASGRESLGALLQREIVEEIDGLRCRFSHDKLREAAYARIAPESRRELHRSAARAIEARVAHAEEPERFLGVLAHHWSMAGVHEKSLEYLGRAAAAALRAGAPRDARDLLRRALDTDARSGGRTPPLERARWLRMLGEAHAGTGNLEGAVARTLEGLATLGEGLPRRRPGWLGVFLAESARRLGREAQEPRGSGAASREARLEAAVSAGRVATSYYFAFELLRGAVSSLRCVRLAESGGAPGLGVLSYAQLGYVAGGLRLHGLAGRFFSRARAVSDSADPSDFAAAAYFEAMYESGLGRWKRSEELASQAVARLERIENRQELEVATAVLANTLYFQGRLREAEARCRTLFESASRRANSQHAGWGLFLAGRSLLATGEVEEAAELLERGHALLCRVPDVVSLVICEGLLARARLAVGRRGEALELADRLHGRRGRGLRRVVPLVQCLDGYRCLADVYWILWQRENATRGTPLHRRVRRSSADLQLFARLFPIAVPAACRGRARVEWSHGRRLRALRSWRRSAAAAQRLAMPWDEALARLDLADAAGAEPERSRHAERARALWAEVGGHDPAIYRGVAG